MASQFSISDLAKEFDLTTRAIRFYEKNGFIPFDKHVFKLGNENQTDIMMKRDLV